jgi:phosphotransferase system HPr (HPr) family protein
MQEVRLEIINKLGLHARAAAKIVSVASRYDARITVSHNGKTVDAKSIMGLMMLGAARGTEVDVSAEGTDESAALQELQQLFAHRFDEEE